MPARVPSYLDNLARLGLVRSTRDALVDPVPYQVLEAQPDVQEALHGARFARVVRRSIRLTPFGEDFTRTCLLDEEDDEDDEGDEGDGAGGRP